MKYQSPAEMQKKIDAYFLDCDKKERPYTVCGLAYALSLTRQGLLEYKRKEEFSDTITRARQRVEIAMEELLLRNSANNGVIFNMKNNFKWRDQSDISIGEHKIIEVVRFQNGKNASGSEKIPG